MKVFHYTSLDNWRNIKRGSYKSDDKPGLGAIHNMGRGYDEAWETKAVFALLEPLPDNWIDNEQFKLTWNYLNSSLGRLLLEIDINPKEDKAFVVDRGHLEGFLYENKEDIPEQYLHHSREEAERAYVESKIPIEEYLKKAEVFKYSLPEVVILDNVPLEKIKISEQQPLLEEELKSRRGEYLRELLRDMENIPELSRWYNKYNKEKEPGELKEIKFGEKMR
ncbi:MAG: hypothetical protein PHU42_03255 [Patescibacteria group bacterium]|nr:hypothetical protein [Patescibacteria group bacterium]